MANERMNARRDFIRSSTVIGAGLLLTGCGRGAGSPEPGMPAQAGSGKPDNNNQTEVTASEDLMREHGVLRRALLVYTEIVPRLRSKPSNIPPETLASTARLFRTFGEDYHESKLEEAYIFPAVRQAGGPAAALADVLTVQHQRGRQITDYILAASQKGRLDSADVEPLARSLESLVLMYRNHAAREDTILFPSWKQSLSAKQYDELGDKFEEIERQTFGTDGFDDAVRQISEIEANLGLADLGQFTAPLPSNA